MAEEKEAPKKLSRRDFVKGAAVGGAGVAAAGVLASCAPAATPAPAETAAPCPTCPPAGECAPCPVAGVPETWDEEADVVVVGYGGAGTAAAIEAHDAGATVLVLEKAPIEGGGSTRISGANMTVTEDPASAADYLYAASFGTTSMEVCEAWAAGIAEIPGWLDKLEVEWTPIPQRGFFWGADFPNLPGAASLTSIVVTGSGPALFKKTDEFVKANGIELLLDTQAKRLVQDPETKEILGVLAESQGEPIAVKAKKAVILSSGGFECNEEMVSNYLRPAPLKSVAWRFNTGDGIRMAQAVGAGLWHMNIVCSSGQAAVVPGTGIPFYGLSLKTNNFIWVDRYGERFTAEKPGPHAHRTFMIYDVWDWSDQQKDTGYKVIPSYFIFDETARLAGPISSETATYDHGNIGLAEELGGAPEPWSDDNSREIEKGWIKTGATIEELADAIGEDIDPAKLTATIAKYNQYCAGQNDPDFHRDPETLLPIETSPYYALEVYPGIFNTLGGPMKNGMAQVLDVDHEVIPRLYTAGTISSSCGHTYSTFGFNISDNIVFGRIAGENAAAEEPWE
jgi:succinate dehydrogenase/fumarate reductase flavoprotein subunit